MIAGAISEDPFTFGSDGIPDPRAFNALPLTTIASPGCKLMPDPARRYIGMLHEVVSVLRHRSFKSNQVDLAVWISIR